MRATSFSAPRLSKLLGSDREATFRLVGSGYLCDLAGFSAWVVHSLVASLPRGRKAGSVGFESPKSGKSRVLGQYWETNTVKLKPLADFVMYFSG